MNHPLAQGMFPMLGDGLTGEVVPAVHEIPSKLVEKAAASGSKELPSFLVALWAIVMRQYIESESVCFGLHTSTSSSAGPVRACCQVSMSQETTVKGLWGNHEGRRIFAPDEEEPAYNTAVLLSDSTAKSGDPAGLLKELEGKSRGNEHHLVLILEHVDHQPQRLFLLSSAPYVSEGQAANISSTVTQTIMEMLANSERPITALNLFSEKNKQDMLRWNDGAPVRTSRDPSIIQAITRQAQSQPNKVAITSSDEEVTYQNLDKITSSLAIHLRDRGVGPDVMVPTLFEKSIWAIIAEIAVMKAGGAFVCLEPAHPDERLKNIIQQSSATIAMTSEKLSPRIKPMVDTTITLSKGLVSSLPKPGDDILPPIQSHAPAYVLFTSGSTGQPKGVLMEHAALAELYAAAASIYIYPESRVSQFAPLSFTMSKIETYSTISTGGTLCIISDHDRLNGLRAAFDRMQINRSIMTPAALRILGGNDCPPSLRSVSVGGEVMAKEDLRTWGKSGRLELHQGYSMSEWTGVVSITSPLGPQSDVRSVGGVVKGNAWVVDPADHHTLVPVGAVGELLLEGPNLARGYLNNPTKTEAAFIEDPAWIRFMRPNKDSPARMYKTGDLFRYRSDGVLQIIGRKDTQVKIRGKRLELEEVEFHASRAYPKAKRVIAEAAIPSDGKHTAILAVFLYCSEYIKEEAGAGSSPSLLATPSKEFQTDIDMAQAHMKTVLPDHMVPSVYLPLGSVPLTVTGKIDRRSLRQAIEQRTREELEAYQSQRTEIVQPTTEVEKQLQILFARVLEQEATSVGIHESFLRLGGDSITAMRLVNACNAEKGYPLTVGDILEEQTISNLCRVVEEKAPNGVSDTDTNVTQRFSSQVSSAPEHLNQLNTAREAFIDRALPAASISHRDLVQDAFPCAPIQQNMLLSQIRHLHYYQMTIILEVIPAERAHGVDLGRLRTAWRRLCQRHQMLRTVFCEPGSTDASSAQLVLKEGNHDVNIIHCSDINPHQLAVDHQWLKPRKGTDWLPRFKLYQTEAKAYALLDMHHAQMDGLSISVILRDLVRFYTDDVDTLPDRPVNYGDYVSYLARLDKEKALAFWNLHLAGREPCLFPKINTSSSSRISTRVRSVHVDLPGSPSRYFEFCKKAGITFANVLKLAWGLVLRSVNNTNGICFGYATAGRDAPLSGMEASIGPFINTVPCQMELESGLSLLQALQGIQSDFIRALPHQHASLAEVHHGLGLGTDSLFNTCITSVPLDTHREFKESPISFREVERQDPTEYAVVVESNSLASNIDCSLRYSNEFVLEEQAADLAQMLGLALSQVVNNPDQPVGHVELLNGRSAIEMALSMRRGSLSGTQSVTGKFWKEKLDAVEAVHFPATPSADYIPNPQDIMTKAVVLPPGCVNFGEVTADVKIQLAWALLVSIYTNAHDIVFGMTNFDPDAAMLDREEMEGLSFTTSLTLIHIDKGQTVREALYNAQEWCKGASAYKDMDLQRISQLSESCAAVCRFQTLIAILPEGVQSDSLNQPSDTLGSRRYPLELQFQQSEGALNTRAVFDSRVLESAEVRRILQQFEHIFSQLYSVPDGVSIGSLDMVNTEDWNDLKKWNPAPPAVELDSRFCVHNVIHQRCQNQTDAPAVCAWDGEFTYQQLDHLAECYAQQLKQHNVRPETFVPLYFEKSRWTVVAQLAVLKAGGAFCMLDPGHPMSRLREMCKDLQPSLVLTSLDLRTSATDLGLPVLVFNEESPQVPVHHYDTNAPPLTSKSPMCVVFTSGSTGRPRGTVLEHRAFYASAMAHTEIMALRPHSRVLQFSGYAFDASIMDHISTLLAGGCICIPSEFDRRNHLATAATNLKTNWALLTPSVIRSLSPDSLPTMKTLVSGGEPLSHDIITRWSSRVQLMNAYGPSECSVMCTINPSIHIGTSPKSLGYSSGGVNWILDPEDPEKPVPIGAIGELVIEGPIVGQGYLNSPERTAAAFIKRPEWLARLRDNKHDYGPLYRSGDLVKYGPDGTIWYIGRRDSQIKLRGQRIELSEVEHHVKQCFPDTQDAVVELVSPDDGRTPVLAAFISSIHRNDAPNEKTQGVLAPATQSFHDQVNTAEANLTERVQSYMIPTMFFPLAQMPLSGSGKVDRRFLRKLASSLSRGDWDAYVSSQKVGPTNEKELILHRAWARVLNIAPEQLGIHDDFFRIGGDSITSMQASSNCRTAGIQVTVADISRHKTIAQLAKHCAQTAIDSDLNNQLMMEDGDGWTELSPIQQMFFDLVPNGESYFNQSALLRLSSTVNPSDVSQAVTFLVRTHAMLRSRYRKTQEGPWLQSIADDIPGSYRFRHHTVNSEDEIQALCEKTERSMNVQEGPVFAVDLFDDMQNKAQHLFLVAHHLVVDMVSWRIMLGDLEELLLRPGAALVPPASTPFLNWCRLQSQYAAQQLPPEKALPIHGIERYIAPSDYWGSPSNTFGDAEPHAFSLDQEPTQKILGTANYALRTQPAELILAAMLHAFSQSFPDRPTPTVFTEGHGREPWNPAIDLTRTVGWFTSMYPVSVSLRSTDRLVDAVSGVKDARRQVPANGWAYFSSRYLNAQGRETFRQTEPMEILFNYLGLYQQLERPGALIRFDNSKPFAANAAGKMPRFALLDVAAFVSENRLHVHFSINRHMKHLSALRQWVQQCESSLRQVAAVLPTLSQRYTPSDFPLSSPTHERLDAFINDNGLKQDDVEDIYPCSPMQEGILLSQAKNPDHYWTRYMWDVVPRANEPGVDLNQLLKSWQQVIDRHATLRAVFAPLSQDGFSDQVILRKGYPDIHVEGQPTAPRQLGENDEKDARHLIQPPYSITIRKLGTRQAQSELRINHALIDAASMGVIKRDLTLAYDGKLSTAHCPRFRDYIAFLQEDTGTADQDYWNGYLEDATPCHFPKLNDCAPEDENGDSAGTMGVHLDSDTGIKQFCKDHGVGITNLFHVVWALVLRRYTEVDSTVFGYITSGRHVPVPGVQDIVGPFINMLVSRINVSEESSILSILQGNQADYAASLSHQNHSLAQTQHSAGHALFNSVVSLQMESPDNTNMADSSSVSMQNIEAEDPTEFPVTLNIGLFDQKAYLHFTYWPSFLTNKQAAVVTDTFHQVLTEVLRKPSQRVNQIDFVGEKSMAYMKAWNHSIPNTVDECVHEIIQRRCIRNPNAPAVCAWDGGFSYLDLDRLSSQLAQLLIDRGIRKEISIPLCFEKSKWVPVAMVGVLKAGAAFVPLDASHPEQRLQQICKDIQAPLILCSKKTAPTAANLMLWRMEVDAQLFDGNASACRAPAVDVKPSSAAYTMFTSGSTGKQKGVVIEHSSLATSVRAFSSALYIDSTSRVFQFASHSFDASILEVMGALCTGGCICIPSDDERKEDIQGAVSRMKVNWTLLTPTVARLLRPADLPTLKTLVLGGEGPSTSDVKTWSPRLRLIQAYGPTECTIACAISLPLSPSSNPRNLGPPSGCCAWVVDSNDHEKLVPIGATGELVVEGPIVGRGYINVAGKDIGFIEAPSWLQVIRGGRANKVYKTGDLARYVPDGSLIFAGRNDTQAKLHGQRMELGELEYHIKEAFPSVQQVIAEIVNPKDGNRDAFLAAFILQDAHDPGTERRAISESGFLDSPSKRFHSDVTVAEQTLHDRLPFYMVPAVFLPLSYVPTAQTSKADRKTLRNHVASMTRAQIDGYRPAALTRKRMPSSVTEKQLQKLSADALNIPAEEIGVDDNLFRLGLDSIGAMKLIAAARREGLDLSVSDIFQKPRLSDISGAAKEIVRSAKSGNHTRSDEWLKMRREVASQWHIPASEVLEILPTTWFQRLYIRNNVKLHFVFDFVGLLDRAALEAAINAVIQKHRILRTVFVPHEDTIVQVTLREAETQIQELAYDSDDPTTFIDSICRQDSQRPVSTVTSDFQPILITTKGTHQSLVLRINHALVDGASMPGLMQDLSAAYEGAPLSPSLDFSEYMKARVEHNSLDRVLSWKELLHGSSMTFLDPNPPETPSHSTWMHSFCNIPLPPTPAGITMATVSKAAWAVLLSRESRSRDVVFGQIAHGRSIPLDGVESVVGPCISLIPVRATIDSRLTVQDLLLRIQDQHIRTAALDTVDLDDILKHCVSWADSHAQVGTVIHYQNVPPITSYSFVKGRECTVRAHQFNLHGSYPYVVCSPATDGTLRVELSVSSSAFDQRMIDQMVRDLGGLITIMATRRDRRVLDLMV